MMASVSKLTVKLLGNPKAAAAFSDIEMAEGKRHYMGQIIGMVTGYKTKSSTNDKGETEVFEPIIGTFEGTNGATGEVYESGTLYLPGGFHEKITQFFKDDNETKPFEFGVAIFTRRDSNASGISYILENLVPTKLADPLEEMRKVATANRTALLAKYNPPALPAPEEKAKK